MAFVFLIVGFILLVKGADFFVAGSASLAKYMRISSLVIGLTIVAFGTSAPEAAVSITASASGHNDIAVSNVVGSNIFNLLVVVGCSAAIRPLRIHPSVIRRDYPFALIACIALMLLGFDRTLLGGAVDELTPVDGAILVVLLLLYVFITLRTGREESGASEAPPMSVSRSVIYAVGGVAAVIGGGQLVVNSATEIARMAGISETLIGLTICSMGTSLPELVTSIVAARKGESDIAIGNAIGSNIFNIFFVLGVSSVVKPIYIDPASVIDLFVLTAITVLCFASGAIQKKTRRPEGIVMMLLYAAYLAYIILR